MIAVRPSLGRKGISLSAFSGIEEGSLSSNVIQSLQNFGSGQKSDVIVVLPRRQVIFKYFSLPSKKQDELRRMVELQALRGLPFSSDDVVFELYQAGVDAQGQTRVVVALARLKMVQECLDVVSHSGLKSGRCSVSAFGVAAWHARQFAADANSWVLIFDCDDEGMDLCFCKDKQLRFARGISSNDKNSLALQVDLTLQAFMKNYPEAALSKVILTGLPQQWDLIKKVLSEKIKAPCQEVVLEDFEEGQGQKEKTTQTSAISLCAGLGMAFASDFGPDLTPLSVHHVQHTRRQKFAILRMAVALLFLIGAFAFLMKQKMTSKETELRAVRQKLAETQTRFHEARRNLQLYDFISNDRKNRLVIAELFKELYQILPATAVLTQVQFIDGQLVVIGQSKESADVGVIQKAMMNSSLFKDVTLQYANRPQRLAMEYTEFKIVCQLSKQGEAKP